MTERYSDLGGQPTTLPVVQRGKGNCGRDCRLASPTYHPENQHADGHVCPWRGDEHLTDCGCTPEENE